MFSVLFEVHPRQYYPDATGGMTPFTPGAWSMNTEPSANDARARFWILLTTSLVSSLYRARHEERGGAQYPRFGLIAGRVLHRYRMGGERLSG